jgi:hypothetical protein
MMHAKPSFGGGKSAFRYFLLAALGPKAEIARLSTKNALSASGHELLHGFTTEGEDKWKKFQRGFESSMFVIYHLYAMKKAFSKECLPIIPLGQLRDREPGVYAR